MRSRLTICAFVLSQGAHGCLGGGGVARVVDGHDIDDRFIAPEAYAAYLEGAYEEERGNSTNALAAYERALALDPDSVELLARIGSIRCRERTLPPEEAFEPARSVSNEYARIWVEMARCELARGHAQKALPHAMHAAELAPRDEDVTAIVVRVFEVLGRPADADRWRLGLRLLETPRKPEPPQAPATRIETERLLTQIDRALASGSMDRSRTLAVRARLTGGELAIRAATLGKPDAALEQARLVLRADPNDADAWIGGLVAADLLGNDDLFREWLLRAPAEASPPSALAVATFTELLARRIGSTAAETWKAKALAR